MSEPYGLRVVGHISCGRRLVDHAAAFAAYANCDTRAEIDQQSFLSSFVYPVEFKTYFSLHNSERDYDGPCGATWAWWDIDRANDIALAHADTKTLCGTILERYRDFDEDHLLVFYSGSKGFHVGLPMVWRPGASTTFHTVARTFALEIAGAADITVDPSIYSRTRLFRAPNSRHAATGRYKRRFLVEEINRLRRDALIELSNQPQPFDIPAGPPQCERAAQDWRNAQAAESQRSSRWVASASGPSPRLTAFARRFIRDGEFETDLRAVSTFRVAAELGELHAQHGFDALVHALLREQALDSGLGEEEVRRQIQCGLDRTRNNSRGTQA